MKPYQLFLRREVVEALKSIPREQQRRLSSFLDTLPGDPFQIGDYTEHDASQREIRIKIVGKFAITYWSDHVAKEVKVVDIARAD